MFVHRKAKTYYLPQNDDCSYSSPCTVCSTQRCKSLVTAHVHVVLSPHQNPVAHTHCFVYSRKFYLHSVPAIFLKMISNGCLHNVAVNVTCFCLLHDPGALQSDHICILHAGRALCKILSETNVFFSPLFGFCSIT